MGARETPQLALTARRWFVWGCLFESCLGLAGWTFAWLLHLPWRTAFTWSPWACFWGLTAVLPLVPVLFWVLHSDAAWAREITLFLENTVRPVFQQWSIWQLAAISALAGVGEELLFRLVGQGLVGRWAGPIPALIVASALFGAFHCVTRAYALFAAMIGLYLGTLWLWSGNLLVPTITHAAYDLVALVWFLRV